MRGKVIVASLSIVLILAGLPGAFTARNHTHGSEESDDYLQIVDAVDSREPVTVRVHKVHAGQTFMNSDIRDGLQPVGVTASIVPSLHHSSGISHEGIALMSAVQLKKGTFRHTTYFWGVVADRIGNFYAGVILYFLVSVMRRSESWRDWLVLKFSTRRRSLL